MKCKICGYNSKPLFYSTILTKYKAEYFFCEKCNFLFIGEPEIWLKEAYINSITIEDTGIIQRNISIAKNLSFLLYLMFYNMGGGGHK